MYSIPSRQNSRVQHMKNNMFLYLLLETKMYVFDHLELPAILNICNILLTSLFYACRFFGCMERKWSPQRHMSALIVETCAYKFVRITQANVERNTGCISLRLASIRSYKR